MAENVLDIMVALYQFKVVTEGCPFSADRGGVCSRAFLLRNHEVYSADYRGLYYSKKKITLIFAVLRIHLILLWFRIRVLDPHWKKISGSRSRSFLNDLVNFLTKQNFSIFVLFFRSFLCLT